jgi:peptidoglycan-N-acetylglucosamine deacetylase
MHRGTVILGFDMEPDVGSWTSGTRGVREGTPRILRALANHGVKATFLWTGREALDHPDIVERVVSDGHEIGCHTMYHENVGNPVYDTPFPSYILESEIRGRLELATETVERVAGVRPVSFRAPRLFGSAAMVRALDELGYVADSSFPAYFHGRNFLPYHPSREDWSKDGDLSILEIPPFFDVRASEDDSKNRARDQWPVLRLKGAEAFADLSRDMLSEVRDASGDSAVCIYLHPWEFVPIPETIELDEATLTLKPFLHVNTGQFAVDALDRYIGLMKQDGAEFVKMKDYAACFPGTAN